MSTSQSSLQRGISLIREKGESLPLSAGVYRMISAEGDVLYVGKAKYLKKRVLSYTQSQRLSQRLRRMVAQTVDLEVIHTENEVSALILEASLIKKLKPRFNILLKDDRSFPFIRFSQDHPFPQISFYRGPRSNPGKYFGPYASSGAVRETLPLLQQAFLLRSCEDSVFENRTRPCLLFHIKRCSAPCVGRISKEEYSRLVREAVSFLEGKNGNLQRVLSTRMQELSDKQDFENAAIFRDRLRALTYIQHAKDVDASLLDRADVIALFRKGGWVCIQVFPYQGGTSLGNRPYFFLADEEQSDASILSDFLMQFYEAHEVPLRILTSPLPKDTALVAEALRQSQEKGAIRIESPSRGPLRGLIDKAEKNAVKALESHLAQRSTHLFLLERLRDLFSLPRVPQRLEVYDNSHHQGTSAYGVMIVASPEGFDKQSYRRFQFKHAASDDDYAMMGEMLSRRLKALQNTSAEKEGWPDLILLDGGKGQLQVGITLLESFGLSEISIAAIAKGPNRNAGQETFFLPQKPPFQVPAGDPLLHFLERLRDEAHRFAISAHRKSQIKKTSRSRLDDIPGIGPKRKRALLNHFGSAAAIADASLDELCACSGVSRSLAEEIFNFFHEI